MKKAILAFTVVAVLSSSSFAQSVGEKTGVNSALGIAPKTEDFIKQAAMSDITEIEAAQIARLKGNAEEKKFAEMMLADHTKTSNELKAMIPANMKAAVPTALDDASQKKLAKLRDAKPEDFASEYAPMPQGRGVVVRALRKWRRRSKAQGLGGKDVACPKAPSRNGANAREEPEVNQRPAGMNQRAIFYTASLCLRTTCPSCGNN